MLAIHEKMIALNDSMSSCFNIGKFLRISVALEERPYQGGGDDGVRSEGRIMR